MLAVIYLVLRWAAAQRAGQATAGRWLNATGVMFGLSLTHHQTTVLLAPAVMLFMLRVQPAIALLLRRLTILLLCAGLPLLLYLTIPWRAQFTLRPRGIEQRPCAATVRIEPQRLHAMDHRRAFAGALRTAEAALARLPQALTRAREQRWRRRPGTGGPGRAPSASAPTPRAC
ncbi:MAG: DUF2723 domain-containing protein [Anaerolineae bacterium]|nr:DUF2723 domain-containing protein [Anaerolineae bacterium]